MVRILQSNKAEFVTGPSSPKPFRRLVNEVSDDILIDTRGYTIVFESRSEEVTEEQSFIINIGK